MKYKGPHFDRDACGVVASCSCVTMGQNWAVTRDWNQVTCRRCMKSRAVAGRCPGAIYQTMSGARIALIGCAPAMVPNKDYVMAQPSFQGDCWIEWNSYGQPPHVDERCWYQWPEFGTPVPRCTLLVGHEDDHKFPEP